MLRLLALQVESGSLYLSSSIQLLHKKLLSAEREIGVFYSGYLDLS